MIAQHPQMVKQRQDSNVLRARQRFGKYRIERRLGQGGFAYVYAAMDTIEGVRVALKMPHTNIVTPNMLECFQREARLVAQLDHPNILPLKDASFIEGRFVIASRLGERTLTERLRRRMSFETALELSLQMISAVAYAHRKKIIHCDIKPENMILLPDGRLQLADFGIARVAQHTVIGSGSGTVGYMAPEQAMGRPSTKSDVFSLGLIMYRMFTGTLPEWPFDWPMKGYASLRRRAHPDLVAIMRKAMEVRPSKRYRDADEMLATLQRVKRRALLFYNRKRKS
jgi:eukaryotic-like serine/threonine-protein kinase